MLYAKQCKVAQIKAEANYDRIAPMMVADWRTSIGADANGLCERKTKVMGNYEILLDRNGVSVYNMYHQGSNYAGVLELRISTSDALALSNAIWVVLHD